MGEPFLKEFANAERITRLGPGMHTSFETITLAGGCFWCLEAALRRLKGVKSAVSGYIGGGLPDPTYEAVCRGDTGHAEAVQVTFDAEALPLDALLGVFFSVHDPTTLNRQGHDVGTQYRSAIFFHTARQQAQAAEAIAALDAARVFSSPVVTELAPAGVFYPAENYHQQYFDKNPHQPYCRVVVAGKVAHVRAAFPGMTE